MSSESYPLRPIAKAPRGARNSTPGRAQRWQERLLSRVSLGLPAALVFACALAQLSEQRPSLKQTLVAALGALLTFVVGAVPRLSFQFRTTALLACAELALIALSAGQSQLLWVGPLLALIVTVLAGLLLGGGAGVVAAVGYGAAQLALTVAAPLVLGSPGSIPTTLALVASFEGLAAICLWWTMYGAERINRALCQRDDLIQLVRSETEERIEQLEKHQSLERQLRQSQKMEALGTLAGGIAHDFNNLLLVISSGAQSAQEAERGELLEILEEIRGASGRGAALTQQLLAFGRRKVNERAPIELNAEIEKSLNLIRRLIPSHVELSFEPDPAVQTIEATAVDVDQIIMNLCINARDAMPQGGRLRITTALRRRPGGLLQEAEIRVEDNGVGMTPEQQERVFEPFYTTKRTGAGTGLGLSVVHTIVKNHQGTLTLDSTVNEGTSFRVRFPHIEQEVSASLPPESGVHSETGETLLLVDDDLAVRKGVGRVLRRAGYEVLLAEDGEDALQVYRNASTPIALVITDAVMPNMGGRELCEAVAELEPGQPCLICSGYDAGTLDEGFFLTDKREFLAKPFENHLLLARVRALLDLERINTKSSPPPRSNAQS